MQELFYFKPDELGIMFAVLVSIVFIAILIYTPVYMKHEENRKRYYIFYFAVFFVLIAMSFSGSLITFYLFYELMTLCSVPLVMHEQTHEAVMGGLKYLFYSLAGAYPVLLGIFFLNKHADSLRFAAGGILNSVNGDDRKLMLVILFLMLMGFSVKAGMFPMHAWLTTAHPLAPAPASAVLSGIIVKAGVFGIIRTLFYVFGADFFTGTWVQTVLLILSLVTVFMGSALAYREEYFKKRLAYSTVSQISYILFGLFITGGTSITGAMIHLFSHAFIKSSLFLIAGIFIIKTGYNKAADYAGIGKKMPVTLWCYTLCSLALIGIPPTGGFLSKWYLATGALASGIPVFRYLGPVVLLISALLTAGYLLPVTMNGFFVAEDDSQGNSESRIPDPGTDGIGDKKDLRKEQLRKEPESSLLIPVIILTVLSLIIGMFPGPLEDLIQRLASLWIS
ncbi:MAG: proton-conducting membrane transporter [Lachnospiraceae bacterium]|nr:proton-conducting membrane transporter [Lachnospiraceae bacterium]